MAPVSQGRTTSNALSMSGCNRRSTSGANWREASCKRQAGHQARPFFSKPLNLDLAGAGIVNNIGRLESSARGIGHEAPIQNDPAWSWLETGRLRIIVG